MAVKLYRKTAFQLHFFYKTLALKKKLNAQQHRGIMLRPARAGLACINHFNIDELPE